MIVQVSSIAVILISVAWYIKDPGYEPVVTFIGAFVTLFDNLRNKKTGSSSSSSSSSSNKLAYQKPIDIENYEKTLREVKRIYKNHLIVLDKASNWIIDQDNMIELESFIVNRVDQKDKTKETFVNNIIRSKHKTFLLSGKSGEGKSKHGRKLCIDVLSDQDNPIFPVYVNLIEWKDGVNATKDKLPSLEDLYLFIKKQLSSYSIFNQKFFDGHFDYLYQRGQFFFIFDSIDELLENVEFEGHGAISNKLQTLLINISTNNTKESKKQALFISRNQIENSEIWKRVDSYIELASLEIENIRSVLYKANFPRVLVNEVILKIRSEQNISVLYLQLLIAEYTRSNQIEFSEAKLLSLNLESNIQNVLSSKGYDFTLDEIISYATVLTRKLLTTNNVALKPRDHDEVNEKNVFSILQSARIIIKDTNQNFRFIHSKYGLYFIARVLGISESFTSIFPVQKYLKNFDAVEFLSKNDISKKIVNEVIHYHIAQIKLNQFDIKNSEVVKSLQVLSKYNTKLLGASGEIQHVVGKCIDNYIANQTSIHEYFIVVRLIQLLPPFKKQEKIPEIIESGSTWYPEEIILLLDGLDHGDNKISRAVIEKIYPNLAVQVSSLSRSYISMFENQSSQIVGLERLNHYVKLNQLDFLLSKYRYLIAGLWLICFISVENPLMKILFLGAVAMGLSPSLFGLITGNRSRLFFGPYFSIIYYLYVTRSIDRSNVVKNLKGTASALFLATLGTVLVYIIYSHFKDFVGNNGYYVLVFLFFASVVFMVFQLTKVEIFERIIIRNFFKKPTPYSRASIFHTLERISFLPRKRDFVERFKELSSHDIIGEWPIDNFPPSNLKGEYLKELADLDQIWKAQKK